VLTGLIAAAVALAAWRFYFQAFSYKTASQIIGLLPRADAVVFYADLTALRSAGMLRIFENAGAKEEPEYQAFVRETGFAYERDLDAIAVAAGPQRIYAVLRGRFDRKRLENYAKAHGGKCQDGYCQTPGSKPDRCISFFALRPHVLGLAISPDQNAAYELLPRQGAPEPQVPPYAAWLQVPQRVLEHPDGLPPAVQVLARSLSSANAVTLGITKPTEPGSSDLLVRLRADCDTDQQARGVRDHLAQLAKVFHTMKAQSGPASVPDLAGVIGSGVFLTNGRTTSGEWRIPSAFVDSLLR
jgi:hypothetical protein